MGECENCCNCKCGQINVASILGSASRLEKYEEPKVYINGKRFKCKTVDITIVPLIRSDPFVGPVLQLDDDASTQAITIDGNKLKDVISWKRGANGAIYIKTKGIKDEPKNSKNTKKVCKKPVKRASRS